MKKGKIIATLAVSFCLVGAVFAAGTWQLASAASSKTGVGLAEHVLKAYNEGWKYSYGAYGQLSGGTRITDCAGLIKSYLWWTGDNSNPRAGAVAVGGGASAMISSCSQKGTINYSDSSSLPRVHGLILYQPGHVGVYVGNNMAVDNRDYGMDVKYEPVFGRQRIKWTMWGKLPQITYPTTGFVTFDGDQYYYEDGEYVVDTQKTIGDQVYTFGEDGAVSSVELSPAAAAAKAEAEAAALKAEQEKIERDRVSISGLKSETQEAASKPEVTPTPSVPIVFTQDTVKIAQAAPSVQEIKSVGSSEKNTAIPAFLVVLSSALCSALLIGWRKKGKTPCAYDPSQDHILKFKK